METCIDDVLKAPGIPAAMADEAGPSSTYAAPGTVGEDSLSLSGELTLWFTQPTSCLSACFGEISQHPLERYWEYLLRKGFTSLEAAARLKQLELETSPLPITPRSNVNVNVALNNQVSI